jgi:hypothetical protein
MQIPILNGIYTDGVSDFRTSYPRNMVPVPKQQGISEGYLRPADGIVQFGTGPGADRGAITWNGKCYRAMGNSLVRIDADGTTTVLASIPGSSQVTFDYSFDNLAVASDGKLYYWNGSTLSQVTDTDLGTVVDFVWVDGYFMTTDGQYLIVTELNDPKSVNPLKYGSSEADPDPIKGLLKLRNEVHALNRFTIEVFQNVGGDLFPFERIEGAQMQRGSIGTYTNAVFMEAIAFLGSGRNEAPAVWLGSSGSTQKLSTREIDQILLEYTEDELASAIMEVRVTNGHQFLYLHLPDQTWVYDGAGSQAVGEPVWFNLTSSILGKGVYRARNFVWCYNEWLCGDPTTNKHGVLTNDVSSHYGDVNGWDFGTVILYNEGRGAVFHELELVALTGNVVLGSDPTIWTSYTVDGRTWSQERGRSAGGQGERLKRLAWLQQGHMRHWRCQKFRGDSDSHISVARIEATVEGLNV